MEKKHIIIVVTIFITVFILFTIFIIAKHILASKNKFANIPTNYNIVNYVQDIQDWENTNLGGKGISDILVSDNSIIPTFQNSTPPEINQLGFKDCSSAITYYKQNNLNMFVPTDNNKSLVELCPDYLKTTDLTTIQDLSNFNQNISNIVMDIDKTIDAKYKNTDTSKLQNYIKSKYPQMNKNKVFSTDLSGDKLGMISNYYNTKMKNTLNPELQQYTDTIYGNFTIIPNQFVLLNGWNMQILSDTIKFITDNNTVLTYNYTFSDINMGVPYIYIKLGNLTIDETGLTSNYDITKLVTLLENLGFQHGKYVHIANIQGYTYAVKNSNFNTMFLIKKDIGSTTTNLQLFGQILNKVG